MTSTFAKYCRSAAAALGLAPVNITAPMPAQNAEIV